MTKSSGSKKKIFISHSHIDVELAKTVDDSIKKFFGDKVTVVRSSSNDISQSARPGQEWFEWIKKEALESDVALVLLTPAAIQSPWILWEAGIITGINLVREKDSSVESDISNVKPLLFNILPSEAPSPFEKIVMLKGDEKDDILKLFDDLDEIIISDSIKAKSLNESRKQAKELIKIIDEYYCNVEAILDNSPTVVNQSNVEEWYNRFVELRDQNRLSEIDHLHEWLKITFGVSKQNPKPIDIRLHRLIGDLYLKRKNFLLAEKEYAVALKIMPRDIFLLRKRGQALLALKNLDDVEEIIKKIENIKEDIFANNVECAALKGQWLRKKNRHKDAIKVFRKVLDSNSDSYYICDLLGQTLLETKNNDEAKEVYEELKEIIIRINEFNIWTYASLASSALVLNNENELKQNLEKISQSNPSLDILTTINNGFIEIMKHLKINNKILKEWQDEKELYL